MLDGNTTHPAFLTVSLLACACSCAVLSVHMIGPTDQRTNGPTDQRANGPTRVQALEHTRALEALEEEHEAALEAALAAEAAQARERGRERDREQEAALGASLAAPITCKRCGKVGELSVGKNDVPRVLCGVGWHATGAAAAETAVCYDHTDGMVEANASANASANANANPACRVSRVTCRLLHAACRVSRAELTLHCFQALSLNEEDIAHHALTCVSVSPEPWVVGTLPESSE